ncbi:uncharacterized protein B0H64DRAFT_410329 [Chaetomium fimeti]|uniref:Uncharacterized protein n=1 Tax=Chaetomium fimeti TaxID=1854472 RepID=A0AAE0H7E4_9PEZI|nr:hypothetical protein B0H64DRAFT_410329 [Chaetomium fimeti]
MGRLFPDCSLIKGGNSLTTFGLSSCNPASLDIFRHPGGRIITPLSTLLNGIPHTPLESDTAPAPRAFPQPPPPAHSTLPSQQQPHTSSNPAHESPHKHSAPHRYSPSLGCRYSTSAQTAAFSPSIPDPPKSHSITLLLNPNRQVPPRQICMHKPASHGHTPAPTQHPHTTAPFPPASPPHPLRWCC